MTKDQLPLGFKNLDVDWLNKGHISKTIGKLSKISFKNICSLFHDPMKERKIGHFKFYFTPTI